MKEALVTGGAGFIGSALTRALIEKKWKVTVFDNLSFGRKRHIPSGARFISGDIRSRKLRSAFDRTYDHVYHLAALHFIPYCNDHPSETIAINIEGTRTLLEVLQTKPPTRFFFASTAAVYNCGDRPHKESEFPEPMDIYGITKLAGEQLVKLFQIETGIPCVIGRLFNAYGPRETNPHLIPQIAMQLRKGKRTIDLGNLSPFRDYIHTSDIVNAIVGVTASMPQKYLLVNISSDQEFSVRQVVQVFEKVLGKKIRIRSLPRLRRKVERMHLRADIGLLKRITNFRTQVRFEDGIRKLLQNSPD